MFGPQRMAVATVASLLAACAPHAPGIADPVRVDGHCSPRVARITGIRSVLTSTNDKLGSADAPSLREIRAAVQSGDGAIAYWNDQRLALPHVSQQLGEADGYARIRAIAIPPQPLGAQYRHVYLLVRDHGRYRWVTMQAFDMQDVCVEGHVQS